MTDLTAHSTTIWTDPDLPAISRNGTHRIRNLIDKFGLSRTHSARIPSQQQQIRPEFPRDHPNTPSDGVRDWTTYIGSLWPLAGEMSCHWGGSKAPE